MQLRRIMNSKAWDINWVRNFSVHYKEWLSNMTGWALPGWGQVGSENNDEKPHINLQSINYGSDASAHNNIPKSDRHTNCGEKTCHWSEDPLMCSLTFCYMRTAENSIDWYPGNDCKSCSDFMQFQLLVCSTSTDQFGTDLSLCWELVHGDCTILNN